MKREAPARQELLFSCVICRLLQDIFQRLDHRILIFDFVISDEEDCLCRAMGEPRGNGDIGEFHRLDIVAAVADEDDPMPFSLAGPDESRLIQKALYAQQPPIFEARL